jgi:hypothetical protein
MLALRKFETVDGNGKVQIDIPQEFGSKVEILVLPVHNDVDLLEGAVDAYFLDKAFEDDPVEDAIWEKYIPGTK